MGPTVGDFTSRFGRGILRAMDSCLRDKRRSGRRGEPSGYARRALVERLELRTLLSISALPVAIGSASSSAAAPGADLVATASVGPGELLLHFALKDFSLQQQPDGTQQIVSSGLVGAGDSGAPELPGKLVRLALPMDTDLATVALVTQASQGAVVSGVDNLSPVPVPQSDRGGSGATVANGKNTVVYDSNSFYGPPAATLVSTQQMGRWKIAEVYLSPFQYNPVAGTVRVTQDATWALTFQAGDPLPAGLATDTNWDTSAAQFIANRADAALWYPLGAAPSSGPLASGSASGTIANGASSLFGPADSGAKANYVVITTAAIQAGSTELTAFVANQQARGFSAAVETESAWGGGTGNTAADNIRNWLKANYVSMGIQYVLLVGNPDPSAGDVPMKMTWPRYLESSEQQAPTDYYYADLTSNWDVNGDGKFGQWGADFNSVPLAEVTVGRIPVYGNDYASLDGILSKTIAYENSSNTAWRQSMLLPMGISNYANETNSGWARTDGSSLASHIQSDLATPAGYSTYTMYEKAGVLPVTATDNASLTETNLVKQWSTNPYGIVAWWSHGNTTAAYRWIWNSDPNSNGIPDASELSFTQFFTSSDTASLSNSHPSIVIQVSCDNGDPQYSSNLGYSLLKQGAVATFCASAYTYYAFGDWQPVNGSSYGDNASYAYYIAQQLMGKPFGATTGAALQWTRENLGTGWGDSSLMNVFAMNLYGDPSLYLFPPARVQGSVVNDVNGNGVRDPGETGLSGQTVFLDDNNNGRIDSGTSTLASGAVNLPIPDSGQGSLTTSQTLNGVAGAITNITVNLNINHTWDSDLTATLVSPAGTQVPLFSSVGGNGHNFTNTTLSDAAATAIALGTAPFTGTFRPAQPLSAFSGQSPNGAWQLKITDGSPGDVGTLIDWTLSITTVELSTTTDANGNYSFGNLVAGTYHVRVAPPSGWVATNPSSGELDVGLTGGQITSGVDFLENEPIDPDINVGNLYLLPNTSGQVREVFVTGGGAVPGLTFNIRVGDGLNPGNAPKITNVDIVGTAGQPTIFYGNNTGQQDPYAGADPSYYATRLTTSLGGTVVASGLLALVTFDTTGVTTGTWGLSLSDPGGVPTDFAGIAANITDGSLTIDNAPVATSDAFTTFENVALKPTSPGVLGNDTDIDGDPLTASVIALPVHAASFTFNSDGSFNYTPVANWSGSDSFTYQAWDGHFWSNTATVNISVVWVNQAPQGASNTVTTLENVPYVFKVSDFGFSDPLESTPNNFLAVKITTLPVAGVLSDNGTAVSAAQFVPTTDVTAGKLVFTPAANAFGAGYASFAFQVQDDGGTANGGLNVDPVARTLTINVTAVGQIAGRYVFYNDSSLDGNTAGAGSQDDNAIAPDKQPLLPGQMASFVNYTSYSGGINGIMVDLANPANAAAINAADFQFRVGNDNNPSAWATAPAPSQISTRTLVGGLTRIEIIWPDHNGLSPLSQSQTIAKEWLQVVVLATTNTNLLQPDVFYFGNAIGETGNSTTNAYVNPTDEIGARMNPATFSNPAAIANVYDFNRDQRVDATDQIIARTNPTAYGNSLKLIAVPMQVSLHALGQSLQDGLPAGSPGGIISPMGQGSNSSPVIADQSFSVPEHSPVGTLVGTVVATDPATPPLTLTYAITAGNQEGVFTIDSVTGQITVANAVLLDYHTLPTAALTVQVTDDGSPSQSASAVITVNLSEVSPLISAGDIRLLANTPDQVRQITVSGNEYVAGLTFNISVGNGLDVNSAPRITGVDIVGDATHPTVFYGNNTGQVNPNGVPNPYPEYASAQTTSNTGLVPATGVLANVTFDTTGFTSGTWGLVLADPAGVATDFAGVNAIINNGNITIVPTALWSAGGADDNWSTAANWEGSVPAGGELLQFAGTSGLSNQDDLTPGFPISGLTFTSNSGAFVLQGNNSLDLGGDIVNSSVERQTVALPLVLVGDNRTLDAAAGDLWISGDISDSGGHFGVIATGARTVVLSGANTYTGGTTVQAGTLEIASSTAIPDGGSLFVGSSAAAVFGAGLGQRLNLGSQTAFAASVPPSTTGPTDLPQPSGVDRVQALRTDSGSAACLLADAALATVCPQPLAAAGRVMLSSPVHDARESRAALPITIAGSSADYFFGTLPSNLASNAGGILGTPSADTSRAILEKPVESGFRRVVASFWDSVQSDANHRRARSRHEIQNAVGAVLGRLEFLKPLAKNSR